MSTTSASVSAISNSNSQYHDNGNMNKPPKFDRDDYSSWKGRMLLFLGAVNDNITEVIMKTGPFIPMSAAATEGGAQVPKQRIQNGPMKKNFL